MNRETRDRVVVRGQRAGALVVAVAAVLAGHLLLGRDVGAQSLPPGLQPEEINVTNDLTYRWGEPEIAVNPTNPDNIVYNVMHDSFTYACQQSGDPECTQAPSGLPQGVFTNPDFFGVRVYVSFDGGKTWEIAEVPREVVGNPLVSAANGGDPMVTVTADGTFYAAWEPIHFEGYPPITFAGNYGCVVVSKSTDGGRTWSNPVCTGTPVDRPWLEADLSTGTIYEVSSGFLGPISEGDPDAPSSAFSDRWLVASQDGVNWSTPRPLGGDDGGTHHSGAASSRMVASNGVVAATFRSTSGTACVFFVGGAAPCTVFQTTTDVGATWTRHRVPVPADSTGQVMVAADPSTPGHYTLAVMNATAGQFLVYRTDDSGATWNGPRVVTEDATKRHFKPWLASSPGGVVGLMWRTFQPGPGPFFFPYNVWAVISDDGGATFSKPLQVSTGTSPTEDARLPAFDDFSFMTLTDEKAFVGWGDWRPGDRSGFLSTVKLQAFTFKNKK